MSRSLPNALRGALLSLAVIPLSACNAVVMDPAGDVARQQRDILLASTGLMLLIIVPVMALTVLFAWRYRQSSGHSEYDPDFHHSTALEVAIWSAPLTIVVALGALTWVSTHLLDPYRPISRLGMGRPVAGSGVKPIRVQVAALDWKWLFIYPDLGVATVNELVAPVGAPIDFQITSSHMMNSFFIPAMAGQIYAMPGMVTPLHAVMNRLGTYNGFSSNYSGSGFSDMNFPMKVVSASDFSGWVQHVRASGAELDRNGYLALEKPSEHEPIHEYARVEPNLFALVSNECADPQEMCVSDMMQVDAKGGRSPEESRDMMVKNQHGGQGGEVGPNAPEAPPSRHRPINPNSREPNAGRPTPPGGTASG
jgi:cytochrome o ubiquinol oxidase subunit II